jgi:hypothetical protein
MHDRSDRLLLALTREMRDAREDLVALKKNGNGVKWTKWLLGIVAVLIAAGVISSVRTYSHLEALTVNVQLFRAEVDRRFDSVTRDIDNLDVKLDRHSAAS